MRRYLALPNKARKLPAVIYLHGSGEGRERFLLPAVWAAGRRAVGMTLTLPSSSAGAAPAGLSPAQSLARERRIFASDVVAVRRAVDVLRSLPQVDPKRIGLVGWSLGARVAAVTAGAEPRLQRRRADVGRLVARLGVRGPGAGGASRSGTPLADRDRPVALAGPRASGRGDAPGRPQGRDRPAGGAGRARRRRRRAAPWCAGIRPATS